MTVGLPALLQSESSTQRRPKHTKGQLQGLAGSKAAPLSLDLHHLALPVGEWETGAGNAVAQINHCNNLGHRGGSSTPRLATPQFWLHSVMSQTP